MNKKIRKKKKQENDKDGVPGMCSQAVPTGISSVMPARTYTLQRLSSAQSMRSLGLVWTRTKRTPTGCSRQQNNTGETVLGCTVIYLCCHSDSLSSDGINQISLAELKESSIGV